MSASPIIPVLCLEATCAACSRNLVPECRFALSARSRSYRGDNFLKNKICKDTKLPGLPTREAARFTDTSGDVRKRKSRGVEGTLKKYSGEKESKRNK